MYGTNLTVNLWGRKTKHRLNAGRNSVQPCQETAWASESSGDEREVGDVWIDTMKNTVTWVYVQVLENVQKERNRKEKKWKRKNDDRQGLCGKKDKMPRDNISGFILDLGENLRNVFELLQEVISVWFERQELMW